MRNHCPDHQRDRRRPAVALDLDLGAPTLGRRPDQSQDAAQQLKIKWDTEYLADVYADADAANRGATAGLISGNVNLGTVAGIAAAGVDVISVGALTHTVTALDLGLDVELAVG